MRKAPFLILPPSRKRPLDTAGLRAHCAQQVENGQAAQVVESLLNLVESLAERCDRLELTLGRLAQAQWGRKSERISSAQLMLALPAVAELPALPPLEEPQGSIPTEDSDDSASSPNPTPVPKKRKKLRQIPPHIPRVTTISEPADEEKICTQCGTQKKHIGCESSEVLEWEPGGFRVEVTAQQKYACRGCQGEVVMGKGPERVLDKAMPGPGLLAEVVVRKIKDHCPLERQSRIFGERFGVPLSASTLGDWLAGAADVLEPIAKRLRARGLQSLHLSTDDTPIQVLDTAHPKGIKRGHIWSFVSGDKIVFFEYTPNWQGAHVQELLKDFQGTLQSDGYAGLGGLFQKKGAPKRAGCLAHARRKFVAAFKAGDLRAARTLQLIQELYQVERRANEDGCDSQERLRRRQESSDPRMQQLRKELDSLGSQAPPKTPLGVAITYALRQWDTLNLFLSDGAVRIDNNHCERSLRQIAVGRKNWLFAGSDAGARRLAILYTVVGSCELAGIRDPWEYVRDILQSLSRSWPHSRLGELLPLAWHNTRTLR